MEQAIFGPHLPANEGIVISGLKLLIADDSVTIQKVVELTFLDEGMTVASAGDGDQAIDKLEEFAPDVVLADVVMPGRTGYEVCEAQDGAQAVAEAIRAALAQRPFAVILMDILMPEVDGLAVLRAVRRTDRTPVIILSARGLVDDRIAGLTAGADDYLPKPFSPAELVLRVERILERSDQARSAEPASRELVVA